ncbi:MAG: hypothetical protein KKB81_07835 [Candidatus Margulisbacteria bacterium]|nr:hypothetical protein [Candidatus Margulisiibacteriota bacterium]MBU1022524.1 hypothetical protein [Candidatus Margulisiibacteriota bacterium]MBU1728400.1 hypothetical protein [Candidatus Margulisiibacteriota bacterium]MBU1955244.1 hypothetical protein [Candidatus Margulisiibacteriota bacterium]
MNSVENKTMREYIKEFFGEERMSPKEARNNALFLLRVVEIIFASVIFFFSISSIFGWAYLSSYFARFNILHLLNFGPYDYIVASARPLSMLLISLLIFLVLYLLEELFPVPLKLLLYLIAFMIMFSGAPLSSRIIRAIFYGPNFTRMVITYGFTLFLLLRIYMKLLSYKKMPNVITPNAKIVGSIIIIAFLFIQAYLFSSLLGKSDADKRNSYKSVFGTLDEISVLKLTKRKEPLRDIKLLISNNEFCFFLNEDDLLVFPKNEIKVIQPEYINYELARKEFRERLNK